MLGCRGRVQGKVTDLLDVHGVIRRIDPELLRSVGRRVTTPQERMKTVAQTRQLCTFLLDEMLFGIDVMNVQEVIRYQEMTAVPLASSVVRGLINLRGQIVTAIDLRARLGLPRARRGRAPMNVVVRTDDGVVSLLVDEIGDVLEVDERSYERAPETMSVRVPRARPRRLQARRGAPAPPRRGARSRRLGRPLRARRSERGMNSVAADSVCPGCSIARRERTRA